MLDRILKATYSAQDCAFGLQHPNLSVFRRDLARGEGFYFPRKSSAGPGGGEYRYAHILEMAIAMAMWSTRKPPIARQIVAGLDALLRGNDYGCAKLNAMPSDERNAIFNGGSGWEEQHFQPGMPRDNTSLVDFPSVYLNEDFISRDVERPTYLIFDPTPDKSMIRTDVDIIENMSLTEARKRIFEMRARYAADDRYRERIDEDCDDLSVLNLTTMLVRIDKRLELRLKASEIRGA